MKIDFFGDGTQYELKALPPIRFAIDLERAGVAYKKLSLDAAERQASGETITENEAQKVYDADLAYREMMITALEMILRGETDERAGEFAGKMEVGGGEFYNNLFLLEAIALGRIRDSETITKYRDKTRKPSQESSQSGGGQDEEQIKKKEKKSRCSGRTHDADDTIVRPSVRCIRVRDETDGVTAETADQ